MLPIRQRTQQLVAEDTIESVDEEATSLENSPKQVQRHLILAGRQKSMPTELDKITAKNAAFTYAAQNKKTTQK